MSAAPPAEGQEEVEPPATPVSKMLGATLARHAALLKELGYDERDDFKNISPTELSELLASLKDAVCAWVCVTWAPG